MSKTVVVFCEGDHDIAFLTRVLSVNGYQPYGKKVKDFDKPLNKLYIEQLAKKKIEDSEFKFQRPNHRIPYAVLTNGIDIVIFHNLDGDGNILNGKSDKIVTMYTKLNDAAIRKIQKYPPLDYRFLYFLDADNAGVAQRIDEIATLLDLTDMPHHQLIEKETYETGFYIFHDSEHRNKNGKLEDLLLKIMPTDNEGIFNGSAEFIEQNNIDDTRQRRFVCNSHEETHQGSIQFKPQKSIIAVAGQLQFSGSSNAVIIANTDYITKADIDNNPCCNDILGLF